MINTLIDCFLSTSSISLTHSLSCSQDMTLDFFSMHTLLCASEYEQLLQQKKVKTGKVTLWADDEYDVVMY